jgi:hypothetical protein
MTVPAGIRRRLDRLELADQGPALRTWVDLVIYETEHPGEALPPSAAPWMHELERLSREAGE